MSGAIKVERTEHDASVLRGFATRSRDVAQSRRLLAIAMVMEGSSRLDIARQAEMDRPTLREWIHRCNDEGMDGLLSRQAPGPTPKLTEAQMAELRDLVLEGPDPAVHQVVRWRCVDLRLEVARRFSVTVDKRRVGKWLHKLGMSRLQPRPYHPKRDAAAQEA